MCTVDARLMWDEFGGGEQLDVIRLAIIPGVIHKWTENTGAAPRRRQPLFEGGSAARSRHRAAAPLANQSTILTPIAAVSRPVFTPGDVQ
jgi:hypothetical protein